MIPDFKTWNLNRNKLQEEVEIDTDTEEVVDTKEQEPPVHGNTNLNTVLLRYLQYNDPKKGLYDLGEELGKAIVDFAINTYVTPDMFSSEDKQTNYNNYIRDKIEESYNKTLAELLRNIGITMMNAKNDKTI